MSNHLDSIYRPIRFSREWWDRVALFDYWCFFGEFGILPFEMHKVHYRGRRVSRLFPPVSFQFVCYGQNTIMSRKFPYFYNQKYSSIEIVFEEYSGVKFTCRRINIFYIYNIVKLFLFLNDKHFNNQDWNSVRNEIRLFKINRKVRYSLHQSFNNVFPFMDACLHIFRICPFIFNLFVIQKHRCFDIIEIIVILFNYFIIFIWLSLTKYNWSISYNYYYNCDFATRMLQRSDNDWKNPLVAFFDRETAHRTPSFAEILFILLKWARVRSFDAADYSRFRFWINNASFDLRPCGCCAPRERREKENLADVYHREVEGIKGGWGWLPHLTGKRFTRA